jgi:tetratricopeptide (TPR) repeat protein
LAQQNTGALRPMQQYFISYRLGQVFYAFCFYVWKFIAPFELSPLYELPFDFDAWLPLFSACAAVVLTITAVLYWRRERWPAVFAAWVYYVIVLAPVAGIAQSGPQLVADRYSYLSCLSWALLLGGGFACLWNSLRRSAAPRRLALGLCASSSLLLLVLGVATWQQSKVWRDTYTLWQHVIAAAPNSSIAYYNLGRLYEDQGQLDISQEHYRRAVQNNPANPDAQYNLARLLARQGMEAEAIARYRQVISIRPDDVDARNNLGLLLARRGEAEGALEEFRKAVQVNPNYSKAFFNMGKLFAAQGDLEKAVFNYHQALKLNPGEIEIHLGLADALGRQGQSGEALLVLQKVVAIQPKSPDGHTALARLLAVQGRTVEAEKHYKEALQLLKSQPASPSDRGSRP